MTSTTHYASRHYAGGRYYPKAQPYQPESINHLYGNQCRSYASNVREITQEDGSLVTEYIFKNPRVTKSIRSSSVTSSDDDYPSPRSKFEQIKAKFEQNSTTHVMNSRSPSSRWSSQTNTTHPASFRRPPVDSISMEPIPVAPSPPSSVSTSERSASSSSRYLDSVDETDEELQYFHRQGEQRRDIEEKLPTTQSIDHHQACPQIQYEITDENGNSIAIDNVHDIIKASGIQAREVQQPDGTIVKEYVIDDPQVASKIQAQRAAVSPGIPIAHEYVAPPPPPPRVIRRPAVLNYPIAPPLPINIQPLDQLWPQQHYQYTNTFGRRIEFLITDSGIDERGDNRSFSSYASNFTAPPMNTLTKNVDSVRRQRTVSNTHFPSYAGIAGIPQQIPAHGELTRSASSGTLHPHDQFAPIITEPIIDWSILRQQDPDGQVDSELVRQFINQRHQVEHSQMSAHLQAQPTPVQANFYP